MAFKIHNQGKNIQIKIPIEKITLKVFKLKDVEK